MTRDTHHRTVRRYYDRVANKYDLWIANRQKRQLDVIAQYLTHPLQHPVLDIGAGTGLAYSYLDIDGIALDLSMAMLRQGTGRRCQGNWLTLPFRDNCFGTVFSVSALDTQTDPMPKLIEMKRVLKIDGYFYLTVLKTEDLAQVESSLRTLGFDQVRRSDAFDAILYWGLKPSGS